MAQWSRLSFQAARIIKLQLQCFSKHHYICHLPWNHFHKDTSDYFGTITSLQPPSHFVQFPAGYKQCEDFDGLWSQSWASLENAGSRSPKRWQLGKTGTVQSATYPVHFDFTSPFYHFGYVSVAAFFLIFFHQSFETSASWVHDRRRCLRRGWVNDRQRESVFERPASGCSGHSGIAQQHIAASFWFLHPEEKSINASTCTLKWGRHLEGCLQSCGRVCETPRGTPRNGWSFGFSICSSTVPSTCWTVPCSQGSYVIFKCKGLNIMPSILRIPEVHSAPGSSGPWAFVRNWGCNWIFRIAASFKS